MIKVGIVGITGFAGLELLKILLKHRFIQVEYISSRSENGKNLTDIYPQFSNIFDTKIEEIDTEKIKSLDVVFLALPHTISMEIAKNLYGSVRIIDLSADFRLSSVDVYEKWYNKKHTAADLLKKAVYGLPELNKEKIAKSNLIANPGCYATSIILPLSPILDYIDKKSIIADSASGVSGAGRGVKSNLQFCEVNENFKAYSVAKHRHTPEVEEVLSSISDGVKITFSPHLLPLQRGILSTVYAKLNKSIEKDEVFDICKRFYKNEFFVRIKKELPSLNSVRGSNFCDIGIEIDEENNRLIMVSAIDNLIKGASGQAVQNMNIMFNLNEEEGLELLSYYP